MYRYDLFRPAEPVTHPSLFSQRHHLVVSVSGSENKIMSPYNINIHTISQAETLFGG